ncbi:ABC transporter substrate-binding protein [Thauera sinica]|uniref:ABC transporter substrate-binding protein n=1 Tax=Thauera sinica TaxID=2665146 RepID=A0ABW1ALL6_9RHOO|nr:ABC transporter substrate-binding protein [Thauera sp. K11]ATE60800.1 ABC transporter substrate-binding protein [Thauera sp. K11]
MARLARMLAWLAAACLPMLMPAPAAATAVVRVGVLQFGTVSWEIEAMQKAGLLEREGVRVEVVPLAVNDAANVAFQGNAVDVIVNDWIWVSRQRSEGRAYAFVPYSLAVGGVMVRPDAGLRSFADLRGKRLGIAGGALGKSWLLLRAYARKTVGEDAATFVRTDFAAPPLLNQLALGGEIPAVLNYWHYNARLQAAGMREMLSMQDILAGLGVRSELPMVGWVFREDWAKANPAAIEGFLRASAAAKKLMLESDGIWTALRPVMRAEDPATFEALRAGYRAGIPRGTAAEAESTARQVFSILAAVGGRDLVGDAQTLAPGTFWQAGGDR